MGRRWLKLLVAAVFGLAGLALVAACNSDDDYALPARPVAFGTPSSTSSSGTSSPGTSSSSGDPDPKPTYCAERPYCGTHGCCPATWRCVRSRCVPPGLTCASDDDCSSDRFCAVELLEPRCFPRESFCEEGVDAGRDCIHATCEPGPDVHLAEGRATCSEVSIYVYNFGRNTLPPGAVVAVDARARTVDAGPSAGDAGAAVTTATGVTTDGILPGEVVLLKVPLDTAYKATLRMRVVHDAGAGALDCDPRNDSDNVYNGCAIPK